MTEINFNLLLADYKHHKCFKLGAFFPKEQLDIPSGLNAYLYRPKPNYLKAGTNH